MLGVQGDPVCLEWALLTLEENCFTLLIQDNVHISRGNLKLFVHTIIFLKLSVTTSEQFAQISHEMAFPFLFPRRFLANSTLGYYRLIKKIVENILTSASNIA